MCEQQFVSVGSFLTDGTGDFLESLCAYLSPLESKPFAVVRKRKWKYLMKTLPEPIVMFVQLSLFKAGFFPSHSFFSRLIAMLRGI